MNKLKPKQKTKSNFNQNDLNSIYFEGYEMTQPSSNSKRQSAEKNSTIQTSKFDQTKSSTNAFHTCKSRSFGSSKGEFVVLSPKLKNQHSFGRNTFTTSRQQSVDYIDEASLYNSSKKINISSETSSYMISSKLSQNSDWLNRQNKSKVEDLKIPFQSKIQNMRGKHIPYGNFFPSTNSMLKLNYLLTGVKKPKKLNVPSIVDIPDIINGDRPDFIEKIQNYKENLTTYRKSFHDVFNCSESQKKPYITYKEDFFKINDDLQQKNMMKTYKIHNRSQSNPGQFDQIFRRTERNNFHKESPLNSPINRSISRYNKNNNLQLEKNQSLQFDKPPKLDKGIKEREIFLIHLSDSQQGKLQIASYSLNNNEDLIQQDNYQQNKMEEMLYQTSQLFKQQLQCAFLFNEEPISLLEQIPDCCNILILATKFRPCFWNKLAEYHKIKKDLYWIQQKEVLINKVNSLNNKDEIIQYLKDPKNFFLENSRNKLSVIDNLLTRKTSELSNKHELLTPRYQQNSELQIQDQNLIKKQRSVNNEKMKDLQKSTPQMNKRFERLYPLVDEVFPDQNKSNEQQQKIMQQVNNLIQSNDVVNLTTDEQITKKEEDFQISKSHVTVEELTQIITQIPKMKIKNKKIIQIKNDKFFKSKFGSIVSKQQSDQNLSNKIYSNSCEERNILKQQKQKQESNSQQQQKNYSTNLYQLQSNQNQKHKGHKDYIYENKNKYQNIEAEINDQYPNLLPHNIPYIEIKTGLPRQQLHHLFSRFKSLLQYKFIYQNQKKQTAKQETQLRIQLNYSEQYIFDKISSLSLINLFQNKQVIKGGFDINIFKKGVPKISIAPNLAVEKLFNDGSQNQSRTNLLWDEFMNALIMLESKNEESKIELFLRIIDENQNGFLSFEEVFNASREVFKQMFTQSSRDENSQYSDGYKQYLSEEQATREQIVMKYNIQGDKFDHFEMSEFLTRYIFDYLDCPYDIEIPTDLIKAKLSHQCKELDLLLMICFQDIRQKPREEYDNSSDEEDFQIRKQQKQESQGKANS